MRDTQVLVFRGQEKLTPERHIDFSRQFGGLYCHVIGACLVRDREIVSLQYTG
jgi:alpha-ketoglutarate-dependent taurine dioxygenase